jgi:uncharacterized protein YndB with AHSA1/START domain
MGGAYHEITPPTRIVFTTSVDDDGIRVLEGHNVVTFEEIDGKTRLTLQSKVSGFVDIAKAMVGGFDAGWSQSLEKLQTLVSAMSA